MCNSLSIVKNNKIITSILNTSNDDIKINEFKLKDINWELYEENKAYIVRE